MTHFASFICFLIAKLILPNLWSIFIIGIKSIEEIQVKWDKIISKFDVLKINIDIDILKIFEINWKDKKIRFELMMGDVLPSEFTIKYSKNVKFLNPIFGILAKIQSLAYYLSDEYVKHKERAFFSIMDIEENVKWLLEKNIVYYIVEYVKHILNSNTYIYSRFYNRNLDTFF